MTIPTFTGYNTALSGLQAAQAAIDTTGENIANAGTPGYTRQVVRTTESDPLSIPARSEGGAGAALGTGVSISSISRIRDQFLDIQYRAQNTLASNATTMSTQLQQLQTSLDEPSTDGLQAVMSSFWGAWASLANDPGNPAAQANVLDDGQTLVDELNQTYRQMQTIQSQAGQEYATLTGANGQVEQDAGQLAKLNQQISQATQAGQIPNQLLDQRDNVLDDLSSLAHISVQPQTDGSVTVSFGDASTPLVDGTGVHWPQTLTAASGGQLGALLNLSDAGSGGAIQTYLDGLANVASTLSSSVNGLLPTGSAFFSGSLGSPTAPLQVASTASAAVASGAGAAHAVANLTGGAADESYAQFVAQLGDGVQAAMSTQTTSQAILTAVGNQRQSVSGVSLDEEMTNLINFQQVYQASARVMNAMDSALNTLINSVGVGL